MRSCICLKSGGIGVSSRNEDVIISADDLADKLVEIGVPERQPPAVCAGLHSAPYRSGRPVGPGWKFGAKICTRQAATGEQDKATGYDQSDELHFQSLEGWHKALRSGKPKTKWMQSANKRRD
ncbi:hypothetical protein BPNPMPFG_006809 (plasmid) [Mesorhizobium sp. AR07]|uniref:hypothetical protein n=1 Tax=Mesorhizobium sp. AR07 TaxID=2865838 RepID=UPI00215F04DF|nr:hypothetical protein [Mesorhizobium sp. AR07]UVK49109.1 hypothetical protein BPNPMPFG_006809 [Mesorhizobium sp. AR07]